MKKSSLFLLMVLCCAILSAQQKLSFSVLEFEQDLYSTAGTSAEHGKKDGNGSWYAIIKVTSNNPDDDITACQFNFGNMSSKVEKHDEALWVYVQRNAKKVTITRPGYHTINQYDLQTTLQDGKVYKMVLTSDRVQQQVVYDVKMQMVMFQITPAVAGLTVMIKRQDTDGQAEIFGMTDKNGAVAKSIDFGRYTYSVMSPDKMYHVSEGLLTVNNSDETFVEKVSLKPNYADMTLVAGDETEIFINNESKGKGRWTGRMVSGEYIITCKRTNHRDCQQRIIVREGNPETIELLQPTPISGSLTVNTTPLGATIKIDGKDYGQSPRIIKDVLIGVHNVELSLADYKTENKNVIIKENDMTSMEVTMEEVNTFAPIGESNENKPVDVSQQMVTGNLEHNIQKLSFSVIEFEEDVFDTSAKVTEYAKRDDNGSWYAIIKVTSKDPNDDISACQFNFGNMSSKVEKHDKSLWVYVQRNAKEVTISRSGYHTINHYDLQTAIESGAVYKMVLTSDGVPQKGVSNADVIGLNLNDMMNYPIGDTKMPDISTYNYKSMMTYLEQIFGKQGVERKQYKGFAGGVTKYLYIHDALKSKKLFFKGIQICSYGFYPSGKYSSQVRHVYTMNLPDNYNYEEAIEFLQSNVADLQIMGYKMRREYAPIKKDYYMNTFTNDENSSIELSLMRHDYSNSWSFSISIEK